MPIIDRHYMEKLDKINKLPLTQLALKFLNGTHEDPTEDRFPHALQLVWQLEREKKLRPISELMEHLSDVAALDDPEKMVEPMGLREEFDRWPKAKQTLRNLALHVLESVQNDLIETNRL